MARVDGKGSTGAGWLKKTQLLKSLWERGSCHPQATRVFSSARMVLGRFVIRPNSVIANHWSRDPLLEKSLLVSSERVYIPTFCEVTSCGSRTATGTDLS